MQKIDRLFHLRGWVGLIFGAVALAACSRGACAPPFHPPLPNHSAGQTLTPPERGDDPIRKLSPDLRAVYHLYRHDRGPELKWFSPAELVRQFGLPARDSNPVIALVVFTTAQADTREMTTAGLHILSRSGDVIYGDATVLSLPQIASVASVQSIRSLAARHIPPAPPLDNAAKVRGEEGTKPVAQFDAHGMTGKGVVVAVIDSGIDWRHPDFIAPDGSSRILLLWDMFDDSWAQSGGKIGSKPPYLDAKGKPIGTVYTRTQITQALHGHAEVRSIDRVGHGTACAGTAASNGRAPGHFTGVAPDADLIVVKVSKPTFAANGEPVENGSLAGNTALAAQWVTGQAAAMHKPVAINMSFAQHGSAHDGTDPEEKTLDSLCGAGKPGVCACVAAGNEARTPFHASGQFGPQIPDQVDFRSEPIELNVSSPAVISLFLGHQDDWGVAIGRLDNPWTSEDKKTLAVGIHRNAQGEFEIVTSQQASKDMLARIQGEFAPYRPESPMPENASLDDLRFLLAPGRYGIWVEGESARVTSGRFDLYVVLPRTATVGQGFMDNAMVGSPGNAENAITVASYDFRNAWANRGGKTTRLSWKPGGISNYSSPGFRRDGKIKPDIAAPGRYAISPLSKDATDMFKESARALMTTPDGQHVAWAGTSAATPYVTGVVALMLQANPALSADRIKKILIETAQRDAATGAVPNPQWGYGKIDPSAAIQAAIHSRSSSQ